MEGPVLIIVIIGSVIFFFGIAAFIIKMYRKAVQGEALVKTGAGGTRVSFNGMFIVPVLHKLEVMDITLKTVVISRTGREGLVCKDNMRADIKVTFFIRVNQTHEDVKQVAQSIGCHRASDQEALEVLFDAKFSEALKTVGKHFDFVALYNSRDDFKREILNIIGTDLNGYVLDDCAIDYLEQTPISELNENNILDAEGIKKIIDLTSEQKIQSNHIEREKEKTITKQDVEAKETVLELERQLAETEAKQKREVESIQAREEAETEKIREEERLKAERAKIATDEELLVAEENKQREILVAQKNKERTDAVESERVQQAQLLEATEKERIVELAKIEKERAVEEEKKNIQDVIRDRVAIQKTVVEEEERMKDIQAYAEADRTKKVAITIAEKDAEEALVKEIKSAEAKKQASEHKAKQLMIDAQAEESSATHQAEAKKTLAEAKAAEAAAIGMAEAQVMEAKASAREKQGESEASVIESQSEAEAKGIELKGLAQAQADEKLGLVAAKIAKEQGEAEAHVIATKADAEEKRGLVEAKVMAEKFAADAEGIKQKAEAMQALDGVGRAHEEFKLTLEKDKEIELAKISIQKEIAMSQASVISEALKAANIDIVGGETMFFDQIVGSITKGKSVDKLMNNSDVLTQVKDTFFSSSNGDNFKDRIRQFIDQFGVSSEDVRNLSISALLLKLTQQTKDSETKNVLKQLSTVSDALGISNNPVSSLGL
ncbi:MAG: flotillin family protein [Bacteroidota bacterium]